MRYGSVLCLCVLGVLYRTEGTGQVLGPELEPGKSEVGYVEKWFRRKMDSVDLDWAHSAIFAKYGVNRWLTLSGEGIVWSVGSTERYPNRDYRGYVLGLGFVSRILQTKGHRVSLVLCWNENFWFDRSDDRYHFGTRSVVGAIQGERTFSRYGQTVTMWLAPAYVYDEIVEWPWGASWTHTDESSNNLGAVAGVSCLLFGHLDPFFHIVYADFIQPRVGIGYQF